MPIEVANEFLFNPKVHMTNHFRKTCLATHTIIWVSDRKQKPIEDRLARKMKERPLVRLAREGKRVCKQRAGLQRKFEAAQRILARQEIPNPFLERALAILELKVAHLDLVADAIQAELDCRRKIVIGNIGPVYDGMRLDWPRCTVVWNRIPGREKWVRTELPTATMPR
jgi:hypothetical protein